jgi:hypothetical protein
VAASHLNSFPAFLVHPTTNQTFTWRVVAKETNRTISRHKNLERAYRKAERLNVVALLQDAVTPTCTFLDERYEYACGDKSTMAEIETGNHFCAKHGDLVLG